MTDKQDFEKLVDLAMANPALSAMRPVVEKELLHYEIFQALDSEGLLKNLVFQGGTSLRLCRGSDRFSEDLDFAGGVDFAADKMAKIKHCIEKHIGDRFGLQVTVSHKPAKAQPSGPNCVTVDKWEVSIETAPENRAMPHQRIKLEIANIPAYTRELMPLLANYESVRNMPAVLVNTETLSEIMADKIVAFPTSLFDNEGRPADGGSVKIRHRDIWDLAWLAGRGGKLDTAMVLAKVRDYDIQTYPAMLQQATERVFDIVNGRAFAAQMARFIDSATLARTLNQTGYADYLGRSVRDLFISVRLEMEQPQPVGAQAPNGAVTGTYSGKILDISDGLVTQRIGRDGASFVHQLAALRGVVEPGKLVTIHYRSGVGDVMSTASTKEFGQE